MRSEGLRKFIRQEMLPLYDNFDVLPNLAGLDYTVALNSILTQYTLEKTYSVFRRFEQFASDLLAVLSGEQDRDVNRASSLLVSVKDSIHFQLRIEYEAATTRMGSIYLVLIPFPAPEDVEQPNRAFEQLIVKPNPDGTLSITHNSISYSTTSCREGFGDSETKVSTSIVTERERKGSAEELQKLCATVVERLEQDWFGGKA